MYTITGKVNQKMLIKNVNRMHARRFVFKANTLKESVDKVQEGIACIYAKIKYIQ